MFDILTDAWAHPGAVHAPILPLDITHLTAESIDDVLSNLHKYGFDSLLIRCDSHITLKHDLLDALFAGAKRRFMPIFADESVVCAAVGCTDDGLRKYNPMLSAHCLALVKECDINEAECETVLEFYMVMKDGCLVDVQKNLDNVEDASQYEKYRLVMKSADGIDILCPECAETFLYGAYSRFIDEYLSTSSGALVGIYTNRLLKYTNNEIFWSFDMLDDLYKLGCNERMLVSLFIGGDRRSAKEGHRLYVKALNERLDKAFCSPASELCGKSSLAFMGDAPQMFASGCARRMTLPMWSREGYADESENTENIISAIRFLGDTARGEGFTGAVYRAVSTDADSLVRELNIAFTAPMTLAVFPECFSNTEYLEKIGLGRAEMKRLCAKIKRESTVATSCGCHTDIAVLCDGDVIPYSGAEKLRSMGVEFNFISKEQLLEKAHIHHGKILIDKFEYRTLLWDQRIRTEPEELIKIGEFATFGGALYRGGAFGDYAKKKLKIVPELPSLPSQVKICRLDKCGYTFLRLANPTDECISVKLDCLEGQYYALDAENGKNYAVFACDVIRLLPGEMRSFILNPIKSSEKDNSCAVLSEIVALKNGDNNIEISSDNAIDAVIELDMLGGKYADIEVNGKRQHRILYPAYSLNVTDELCNGVNSIRICAGDALSGALLRIKKGK